MCQTEACVIACERQTNRNLRDGLDVVVGIMSLAEPGWCYYPHGQKPGDQLQVFVTMAVRLTLARHRGKGTGPSAPSEPGAHPLGGLVTRETRDTALRGVVASQ